MLLAFSFVVLWCAAIYQLILYIEGPAPPLHPDVRRRFCLPAKDSGVDEC